MATPPTWSYSCADMRLRFASSHGSGGLNFTFWPRDKPLADAPWPATRPLHPAIADFDTGTTPVDAMGDSLVHLHVRGDGLGWPTHANGWAAGHTMRHSETTESLRLLDHRDESTPRRRSVLSPRCKPPMTCKCAMSSRMTRLSPAYMSAPP